MKYVVIHTNGQSVEQALLSETRDNAIDKAIELAEDSGFFEPNEIGRTKDDLRSEITRAKKELEQDGSYDGWGDHSFHRVTVKPIFMI